MKKVILDGPYKIKETRKKLFGMETRWKETIGYREVKVDDCRVITEGKVMEYYRKEPGDRKFKLVLHMTGYSFLTFFDKKNKKFICGIQGREGEWLVARDELGRDWNLLEDKKTAFTEFLKLLRDKYKIELVIKESEVFWERVGGWV